MYGAPTKRLNGQVGTKTVPLAKKIEAREKKYDAQFKVVFDAIRSLMAPPTKEQKKIGFRKDKKIKDELRR